MGSDMGYSTLVCVLICLALLQLTCGQQQFTRGQIPSTFIVGTYYPTRSGLNALQTEEAVCRPIVDYIDRNSARFNAELVTNTNSKIQFQNADSRIMSSRMQSRLDRLADLYTAGRMTIKKAWSQYPDPQLPGSDSSLHFEGRTVSIELSSSTHYDLFLKLAIEAAFDWVYYESSSPRRVRLSVIPSSCERSVDVVFMLDRSGSVGPTNHGRALDFIRTAVSFFTIGSSFTRVGVVAYGTSSTIQFDLNDYFTLSSLQNAINNVAYTGGATNTPAALDHARFLLTPSSNRGARPNSAGIPKIAILITDGRSNRGNLNDAINRIRNTDIQVYAVGIGNIDVNQLRAIATDPDDDHVFILQNYLDAAGFVDLLSATTCDTPAIIDPGDNVTTVIPDGGINYFQTSCSIFTNKVLIELIDVTGTSFLYASSTETNPGPLTPNTQSNTTVGVRRRTVTVPLSSSLKVVYIGVQGQTSTVTFTILVWDQLFDPVDAFINVVEGAHTGVTIYEVRRNLTTVALNNMYIYSFIEGNGDGVFAIDSNDGRVFIPSSGSLGVNFDRQRTHNLTVQARNRDQSCQISRIRINIRVISNRITFNPISTLSISEIAAVGTQLVQVVATGGAYSIQYSIVQGNGPFEINSDSGRITLRQILNYETTQSYVITVRADSTGPLASVTGDVDITIMVQDINESPSFTTACARQSSGCSFTVAENRAALTLLGTISASDPDLPSVANGMLQYQLTPASTRFSVDNAGRLRTTVPLDREAQSSYTFTLTVRDRCSGCALSDTTTVRITVTDINDNAPVFTSRPATVQVSEDTPRNTVVAEFRATDADEGTNAVVRFTLSPSNVPFTLSSSGTLSLTGPIDYEDVTMQSYSITITASNPGTNLAATTTSTIQILNVNDNTPVISGEPYVVTVAENSRTGTLVTTVTATDADLGIHGEIRYAIISGNLNQAFALNPTTGALTVNANIDRESVSSFDLVVRARDRGTPQTRQDRTTIAVTVSDINDNAPIFRPSSYSVQLREDLPVGHNVIRVLATDADQPNTSNSIIAYSITSGNTGNAFSILSNGQIQISQRLDFETTPSYSLTVEGRDGGSPAMSSTATVAITVINVNENPPTLTGDQSVSVSESTPQGTEIAVFEARDLDQMRITLSIASGNSEMRFAINSETGSITLAATLDYEMTTSYTLTIRASDGEQNTDSTLTVQVLDENEFSPQFSGPPAFMILEQRPSGSEVGTVTATDGDRDAQITYSFVGQNQASTKFNLDPTSGVITTNGVLDREALTQVFIPPSSQVTLQVAATDNGSPSRQSFRDYTITLTDINDNTPTFSDSMYSNQLRENLPAGQDVFSPSATDIDLGTNAEITYSFILTNNLGSSIPFQIDSATGAITTTAGLDCELQPFYLFSITATDRGSPPLSSTVTGNLTLIDENDNSPQFSQSVYYVTVPEDFSPGGIIMTFTATDRDKGVNGEVEYSVDSSESPFFLEGETDVVFSIDFKSGELTAITSFNFERDSQVNVTVFANDGGIPRRSASALLVITVTNVDEFPPSFSVCNGFLSVNENVNIGTTVGRCQATDSDTLATENQLPIRYSLRGTSQFSIDPNNGEIRTATLLDRESEVNRNGVTSFTVDATDLANQTSSRLVRISIADVNDNAPQFSNTPYRYHFTEDFIRSASQEFLTIEASDLDAGNNAMFALTVGSVVRTTEMETQVEIIARDNGIPSMNSSTRVTVTFESPCQLQQYVITGGNTLSARLLCSVEVSSDSNALTLGMTGSFNCRIFGNTPGEVQFLHNGTAISSSTSVQTSINDVPLSLNNVQMDSAGQYACRVLSDAGSLQSVARQATIQVIPVIINLPKDTSAELGSTATFECAATGIPVPNIEWFVGTQLLTSGNTLSITNVDSSRAAVYTCGATNNAGKSTASARLVIYDKYNIIQIEITNINNPSSDSSCQYFDPSQLSAAINSVTKQRVMVASSSGTNLCELSPCSPSPCQNHGKCTLKDVVGGYECTCRRGFTGVNCTVDINECSENPCGDNGNCTNTMGSFRCDCNQNYTGRMCQIEKRCTPSSCPVTGDICLDGFSGFECKTPNPQRSIVVFANVSPEELADFVQLFIDEALQSASSGSTSQSTRRKRQVSSSAVSLNTSCQPNFVALADGSFILIWSTCPPDEMEPTSEQQQMLCSYLFDLGLVSQCKLPDGETMTAPTAAPLPPTSVKVDLVFVDDNNKPIDAVDSVKTLQDKATQEALANSGVNVASVVVPEPPRPEETSNSESNLGAALGGAIGGLIGIALLAIVIIIIVVVVKRMTDSHKERQYEKKQRAQQMINLEECNTLKSKMSTMASVASTDNLISDSNDYDILPPKFST